jgi:hypothetical protein
MSDYRYQPYYCEENVWHLCRQRAEEAAEADRYVLVLSNPSETCALWQQRAAPAADEPVVWDYHVVLSEWTDSGRRIWDLDTRLPTPVDREQWIRHTFPDHRRVSPRWTPLVRRVEGDDYLASFSSDRSHMRDASGEWRAEPPPWEPIYDPETGMNLPKFVDMEAAFLGDVLELEAWIAD